MTTLSAQQMAILQYHAEAGDRIAYYAALANFGVKYGEVALGVVLNNTISGASANNFFAAQATAEGVTVTGNLLAEISLGLMRADFLCGSEVAVPIWM